MVKASLDPTLDYMCEEHLEFFRQELLKWREQLLHNTADLAENFKGGGNYPDLTDRASHEESFNLELRERERERKLLKKIEATLQRINNHDYGYCEDCGAEIGLGRLEARLTASKCIECKTIAEIKEKLVKD